jgi:hypothetical protein
LPCGGWGISSRCRRRVRRRGRRSESEWVFGWRFDGCTDAD